MDRLAQEITPRQVLEWRAFERVEGIPLGSRGDWLRQALAVSRDGRDPKTFQPWHREAVTRPFAEFKKSYPFMFPRKES